MLTNPKAFFDVCRSRLFGGRIFALQVRGLNAILDAWAAETGTDGDDRQLAYVLATAFHETGAKMSAVRESFSITDEGARARLSGSLYAVPDPKTGHSYYGRGLVQLTWRENYEKLGRRLALDLVNDPDMALDVAVAARIIVVGMLEALFTGRSLDRYFSATVDDPINARRIINGVDRAALVASYHNHFLAALIAGRTK